MKPIRIILPLVAVAAVVGLFLLFMPAEPGFLYWFNFVYALLLFGGVAVYWTTPLRRHSTAVDIAVGTLLVLYALSLLVAATVHFTLVEPGVIWVLADFPDPYVRMLSRLEPLFQENPALAQKIYFAAIVIASAITAAIAAILLHADTGHQQRQQVQQERTRQQRNLSAQMQTLLDGRLAMRNLAVAFRSLTPNVIAKARPELEQLLDQTEDFLSSNPSEEEQSQYCQRTIRQVNIIQQQSKN